MPPVVVLTLYLLAVTAMDDLLSISVIACVNSIVRTARLSTLTVTIFTMTLLQCMHTVKRDGMSTAGHCPDKLGSK